MSMGIQKAIELEERAETPKPEPKGQTIAQVLRALKPFLPEGYVKISDRRAAVGYRYEGRISVEVFGVCQWDASTLQKEGCRAISIRVTPYYPFRQTSRGPTPAGLRTVVFKPSKAGTFNLANVGARIQRNLAETREMEEARKKETTDREAEAKGTKAMTEEIRAYLLAEGLNPAVLERYNQAPLFPDEAPEDEEDFHSSRIYKGLRGNITNNSKRAHLELNGLTLDQLVKVLRALKPSVVRTKPVRIRRRRS